MEEAVLELRGRHPAWGGRKIHHRLKARKVQGVPAPSTITGILRRHGLLDDEESAKHKAWQRFEAEAPNDLWQMDFKGHFQAASGRCHPLTVLDDHSRYSLCVDACNNEKGETVRGSLMGVFRRYGLPLAMVVDQGSPWGNPGASHHFTALTVWLMRLGMRVIHARPYHPQTLGKDERFHRTLKAEVINYCKNLELHQCQLRFDAWRDVYNLERPHQALDMNVPASRYRESKRSFPETLPPIEYGPEDQVRKVTYGGWIYYLGKEYRIPKAFKGYYVALRHTMEDGIMDVFFCNQKVAKINLRDHNYHSKCVTHVPEHL
jgi:transposase InsO family protein